MKPPPSSRAPLLPPQPTRFVGRERDLARLGEAPCSGARLLTVCGPPGIGKTRLALEVTRREQGWFCDLSEARDAPGLFAAVGRGLASGPLGDDPAAALGRRIAALGGARIVLDNFEQLVDEAPASVGRWLALAPEARLLVTSRERLRLREEVVFELGPLALDGEGGAGEPSESVALLLDRVRAGRPSYRPGADELAQLAQVTRAVEGIPLAIELAAARLEALGAAGLLERLAHRLDLLSRGARGDHDRQATLRGAVDWSWQLLDERQRAALARCAVFRGGFDLAAAEALVGADALDVLQDLRDRSLVRAPEPGRFALYESIREFAAEQLAARGETERIHALHAAHYLALAEAHAARFERCGGSIEALLVERDNLLVAIERALGSGRSVDAARGVLALGPVLTARGPVRFHLTLLERVMDRGDGDPRLLHARGVVRRLLGQLDGAEEDLLAALEETTGGPLYVALRKDLGVLHHQRRAIDAARACYEAALPPARALGDRRAVGIVTGNLGALAHDIGRFEEAARFYAEALDLLREVGDARVEGIFLVNLGVLEQEEGRAARARGCFERALALLEQVADWRYLGIALGNLGVLEHESGALAEARARHEQALELLAEVGEVRSEALCRARLGAVLAALGDAREGALQIDRAERLVLPGDTMGVELVRLHRAYLDLAAGDEAAAFARLEAAQSAPGARPSLVAVNDDARILLRMLSRLMAARTAPRLEVGPEARWFRPPGLGVQALDKHLAVRRILDRLATQRLTGSGTALSADELFEAGWPGVKITTQSAHNRLYVALAKLRKLGLKVWLLRNDDGYLLDPGTPLVRLDGDPD